MKKNILLAAIGLSIAFSTSAYAYTQAKFQFSHDCILEAVAKKMGEELRDEVKRPLVYLEGNTPLEEYQNQIEENYGMRPDVFLNVYLWESNAIFLNDNAEYLKRGRTVDDVLAHEYAHYIQAKYKGLSKIEGTMDGPETEAVSVQHWFRETYTGENPKEKLNCAK